MSAIKRIVITLAAAVLVTLIGIGLLYRFVPHKDDSLTDDDLKQLDYVNEKLGSVRNDEEYLSKAPEQQMDVMLDAINQLADEGQINAESILCDREELYITYEYECGVLGFEEFGEADEFCGGYPYINCSFEDLQDEEVSSSEHRASVIVLDAVVDHNESADRDTGEAYVTIAGKWADRGADTKIDYSVTLDDLAHLDEYDFIDLYMHGKYENYMFRGKIPMMKTVQEVNEETNKAFSAALASHSVATGSGCYAVTPDFFTEQYGSDGSRLDGKFFFLASCRQMGADGEMCEQWSDALIKAGASAVVAFQNDADKYYATQMANIYGQLLLDGNAAGEAFESAVEQTVNYFAQTGIANSPYFVPLFRGESNASLVQGVSVEATAEPIPTATESTTTSTSTPTSDITPTPTPTPEVVTAEASTVTVDEYGHVIFGRYEQDGDLSNGPEPIVWELLSQEDGSLLLISRDIIDAQPFNTDYTEVTWEDCSLRRWLNNDFLNEAFSEAEQGLILTTVCEPDSTFGGERGSATEDKVFCLSAEEVFDYYEMIGLYENNMNGYCLRLLRQVTQYAIDRGVWHHAITEDDYYSDQSSLYSFYATDVIGMDGGMWWLRTPGNFDDNACRVTAFGAAGYYEYTYVDDISVGVRPVIRLDSGSVPADANLNRDDVVGMWRAEFGEGEQTTLVIYATGDIHGWHTPSDTSGIDYELWGTWDLDGDCIVIDWEDGTRFESEYSADGNTLVLEAEGDRVYMRID